MSRETTFDRDLHPVRDRAELGAILTGLCERLSADLTAKGYRTRTVGVKLRYADFRIVTRDLTDTEATADPARIRRMAGLCLKRVDLARPLRLLGVRASRLEPHRPGNDPSARSHAPAPLPQTLQGNVAEADAAGGQAAGTPAMLLGTSLLQATRPSNREPGRPTNRWYD